MITIIDERHRVSVPGWVKSAVFGKSFRLTRRSGSQEYPDSSLEIR
jgi:hypothetical protein